MLDNECFKRRIACSLAVAHFVAALETGAPFETDRLDNLETLRLVDDAYRLAGQ